MNNNKSEYVNCQGNSSVEVLDVSDNDIGPTGAEYLAETLRENTFIKSLVRILQ